jgi:hypothetical protein
MSMIDGGTRIEEDFPDSSLPASSFIRENIKEKVNSVLWLDSLLAEDELYARRLEQSRATTEKCMVCTLPYGTCEHTKNWMEQTFKARTESYFDETLDKTINDMINVIDEFNIETAPVEEDIDISKMMWKPLEERLIDKIGKQDVCLFAPDERGWHSTVRLASHYVYVFGGFKYRFVLFYLLRKMFNFFITCHNFFLLCRNKHVPQPFTSIPAPHDVEYLNDLCVYDTQHLTWHGVRARGRSGAGSGGLNISPDYLQNSEHENEQDDEEIVFPEGRYGNK